MQKSTVIDRYGNMIYFTKERWLHILESRPELDPHFALFLEMLRSGRREQDAIIPNEYLYTKRFKERLPENSHVTIVVVFKKQVDQLYCFAVGAQGKTDLECNAAPLFDLSRANGRWPAKFST
jgi:hypothetical protein